MTGIPDISLDNQTLELIREFNIGGIILFSRNIESPIQIAKLCGDIQDAALKAHGHRIFISIDQEGGRVARLKAPFTEFPGNAAITIEKDPEARAREFASITAEEMNLVGINMNLAPVVDVQRGELEKHLLGRAFSEDPAIVSLLGGTVIKTLQENGVMAVAKHFPGLGRATIDPHLNLPRIDIDIKELEEYNLPPFYAAIEEEVSAIMTSHAVYDALDRDNPATLSYKILTEILRDRMSFNGLIITDDLEMGAIINEWSVAEGALYAFRAGADILLICEHQDETRNGIELLRSMVLRDEISRTRLNQSIERINKARKRFLKGKKKICFADVNRYFDRVA
jgi:beta-N-acetylhexosaminidase